MGVTADLPRSSADGRSGGAADGTAEAALAASVVALDPDTTVVTLSGPIDAATAAECYRAMDSGMRPGVPLTVVDLSGVPSLAGRGITALADAARAARLRHVTLRLAGVAPAVAQALESAGLTPRFDIHPTVAAALRHRPVAEDA